MLICINIYIHIFCCPLDNTVLDHFPGFSGTILVLKKGVFIQILQD